MGSRHRTSNRCPHLWLYDNSEIKTILVFPFELLLQISPPQAAGCQPCLLLMETGEAPELGMVRGQEVQLRLWVLKAEGSTAQLNSVPPGKSGVFLHLFIHVFLHQLCSCWIMT